MSLEPERQIPNDGETSNSTVSVAPEMSGKALDANQPMARPGLSQGSDLKKNNQLERKKEPGVRRSRRRPF